MGDKDLLFCSGTIFGLIVAFLVGFISLKLRDSRMKMGQKNRPLDTFPDASQSSMTPSSIYWKSQKASISWTFWLIVLIGLALLAIRVFKYIIEIMI
ncbi:MAG: hypothetical protein FJ010_03305 [Chloroflexi bacterium]|nr:hypothetical protein [Chloroflexota bacterium]